MNPEQLAGSQVVPIGLDVAPQPFGEHVPMRHASLLVQSTVFPPVVQAPPAQKVGSTYEPASQYPLAHWSLFGLFSHSKLGLQTSFVHALLSLQSLFFAQHIAPAQQKPLLHELTHSLFVAQGSPSFFLARHEPPFSSQ